MILIVTNSDDPHTDIVVRELRQRGAEYLRFNTDEFPNSAGIDLTVSRSGVPNGSLRCANGASITLDQVQSVWYRRPSDPTLSPGAVNEEARQVATAECMALLRQLWACLYDRYWMSYPMSIKRADQKLLQLRLAGELGLAVPETRISQDAGLLDEFCQGGERSTICKTISGVVLEGPPIRAVYTTIVTPELLRRLRISMPCPTLFQQYVEKSFELRVTVVEEQVFAARMDTQVDGKTEIDWRRGSPLRVPHSRYALPAELERKCAMLVKRLGLAFGAIDMVVTPAGEHVFLEINPNGQWAWIEGLTGMPIASAICDALQHAPAAGNL